MSVLFRGVRDESSFLMRVVGHVGVEGVLRRIKIISQVNKIRGPITISPIKVNKSKIFMNIVKKDGKDPKIALKAIEVIVIRVKI